MALRFGAIGLICLIVLEAILANLFVVKQMSLFGLSVTCSDVFAVGSLLALNLLREFYGEKTAQQAIGFSFFGMLFFVLMSQIHLFYFPNGADVTDGAFRTIFSATPRIICASAAVYFIVQQIDVKFFGFLKHRFQSIGLPVRVGLSLLLSQAIDTTLFSFVGLYGLVASVFDIIAVSLVVKAVAISCSAPLTAFAKRFVRSS